MTKAPAKRKAAPAKRRAAKAVGAEAAFSGTPSKETSIQIRQISNGYIVRKSGMVGSGPNARYVETEVYSKTAPKIVQGK